MTGEINKICLGCPELNRDCDGIKTEGATGCKSQNPEARRRYARRLAEIKATRSGGLNSMCVTCQHLNRACDGTKNPVWSDCILKDRPPEEAKAYIDRMTELIAKEAK